ncbi:peptidoglycan DD-metalloendopeptidase family protein [Arthrobacter sp.]|uniref:M23 family metallopeptidase n=1 Tax=Arthrobacter sp. TaxID=1667 RepID=UPI003A94BF09
MGQQVPQHPAHLLATPRPLFKWVVLVAAGTLLIGTAPAAGVQTGGTDGGSPSATAHQSTPKVSPVYAIPEASPLLDPTAASSWAATWTPGYQPLITSEVGPDGSALNGEGVSGTGGTAHIATGPAGLLPGGLVLSAPVSSTRITSGFGWRLNPTGPGSYIHIGQDYGVPCGTAVRAAEDGTVVQSAWAGHSGQRVRVDHGSGVETAYSHNSLLIAHVGDTVRRGDLLALSGTTGNSTGCHVHFEVYLNGKWVDPALYLPLLPGQNRPVTGDERQQIADSRLKPVEHAAAASSSTPSPGATSPSPAPASSTTPPAARETPSTRPSDPAVQASPKVPPTAAAPTSTPAPPSTQPTAPPTPSAKPTHPASPPAETPAPPSQTPTSEPVESADPTPPAESPAPPSEEPTPPPSASPTAPPAESPDPTPPAEAPGTTPTDPPATPPSLASLCVAYQLEDAELAKDPSGPALRVLSEHETTLLARTLAAQVPKAPPLQEDPTVHQVVMLCPAWFPDGIDTDTAPADLAAVQAGEAASTREAENSPK